MKVKGILSEEKVTLPELRAVLMGVESERIAAEKEDFPMSFGGAWNMPISLAKTTPEKSKDLVDSSSNLRR